MEALAENEVTFFLFNYTKQFSSLFQALAENEVPADLCGKVFEDGDTTYACRDCALVCHKPCHVNVAEHCLETSLPAMEL